jgi:hypothetical protein
MNSSRTEKIGPVAILETPEGLRVAVYLVREFAILRKHASARLEVCDNLYEYNLRLTAANTSRRNTTD